VNVRTTIVIDDGLTKQAMRVSGTRTKSGAVRRALGIVVRPTAEQEKLIRPARSKFRWEGDLAGMRRDRNQSRGSGNLNIRGGRMTNE
jgi:Arc/MetJ family transcription regulator